MDSVSPKGTKFDSVTGEVIESEDKPDTTKTKAVVPAQSGTLTDLDNLPTDFDALAAYFAEPEPDLREVFKAIMGLQVMEDTDPEETTRAILARIMSATTADDILKVNRVVHAKEILGVPIEIFTVKWQKSTFEEGASVYAVIEAQQLGSDNRFTATVGGRNVMMQLLNMQHRGFLPFKAVIEQAKKPTEAGYYPLWLAPA